MREMDLMNSIREVDLTKIDESNYENRYVGCLVLTKNHRILLQQRGPNWDRYPGYLAEFGGRIEPGETSTQALMRELHEELGAQVKPDEVVSFGAITEKITQHKELIYVYFWHDKNNTITGCYEGKAKHFDNVKDVFSHPKIMHSTQWLLNKCQAQQLI